MPLRSSPIGVFDSGIGGLTVLSALKELLPFEDFLYFADTAYLPYGDKSVPEIISRTLNAIEWMKVQRVKLLVIACHTSSALFPHLRPPEGVEVLTMTEPTLQSVTSLPFTKGLGILATPLSVKQGTLERSLRSFLFPYPIYVMSCPSFVPLIESFNWKELEKEVSKALEVFRHTPVDYILYGCTHYPMIRPFIPSEPWPSFIDPSSYVSRHAVHSLQKKDLLQSPRKGNLFVHCSGASRSVEKHLQAMGLEFSFLEEALPLYAQ